MRSLADAMRMLKQQVDRTPAPQWVRVVGGFTEHQFAEKRLPTLEEINAIAPDTPVFILHLYDRALLNGAALRAVGYTKDTPNFPGGEIVRDGRGEPTGLLIAKPNATVLYATLAKGPKLPPEYQKNSTRHFMREMNRLGVTGVIDAGGGFQNYPEDYKIIEELHNDGQLTIRIAYNLFTQKPKEELKDFESWAKQVKPGQGDDSYRNNGAGEMLVYSAADYEDFQVERPELPPAMEGDLEPVIRLLAQNRWPWRLHATYNETITRALDVFEKVDRDIPLDGPALVLRPRRDHRRSQHRAHREARRRHRGAAPHGLSGRVLRRALRRAAAERTPPIRRMLEMGMPVGAGTDATRVAATIPGSRCRGWSPARRSAGLTLYPAANRLDRETALRLWTEANTWFSTEQGKKGQIAGPACRLRGSVGRLFLGAGRRHPGHHSRADTSGRQARARRRRVQGPRSALPPAMPDWSPVGASAAIKSAHNGDAASK